MRNVLRRRSSDAFSLISEGTRNALAKARQRGVVLGNPNVGKMNTEAAAPPFGYALMQVVEQTVKGAGGTDDANMAEFARENTFKTVVGDIKFNADGEWQ